MTAIMPARRLPILDFWRALSIILVMAGHLLPLGPKSWELNEAIAATGMVMFFTLSGFLITRFLIEDGNIRRFFIRRMARILPLAWVGITLAFFLAGGTFDQCVGSLLFYANLPPFHLLPAGGHFWSLCVEVQFYAVIGLIALVGRQRALSIIPVLSVLITAVRMYYGQRISIVTWFRIDEILAGSSIALIYEGWLGESVRKMLASVHPVVLAPFVLLSSHHLGGALEYARPYLSAVMIGGSLYRAPTWMQRLSTFRPVTYVAEVSYALYVFHGIFQGSWLGSGSKLVKYAKRPILIAATFMAAHFSTFYFERFWIRWGRTAGGSRTRADLRRLLPGE